MPFHFNIGRDDLLKAISAQQNITSKKGTLAILSNVLLEVGHDKVIFTGTDLQIGLKQTVPAEVLEPGTLTLPAKKLFELARESGSSIITFKEEEKNWVKITAGPSLYKLAGMVSEEFPQFPEYDVEKMVEIESDIVADLVDKTFFSIAQDKENMFSLTAALLEKVEENETTFLKMISSDGHRLTVMSKEISESTAQLEMNPITLIPRRGVQEMRKFCDNKDSFSFGIEEKQAVFKDEDSLLIIRLMEGEFPDYKAIISSLSLDNNIIIDRLRFLESLKRINLFTEDLFHAIKMEISDNNIVLNSQNADFGSAKDEFKVEYDANSLSLGFNCKYFMDTLQVINGEKIIASIQSDKSPCLITSEDDEGFTSVIMPMKL